MRLSERRSLGNHGVWLPHEDGLRRVHRVVHCGADEIHAGRHRLTILAASACARSNARMVGCDGDIVGAWQPTTSDVANTPPRQRLLLVHWPNPSNPATTIRFHPGGEGPAMLDVYAMSGRLVRTLVRGVMHATPQEVVQNGTDSAGRAVPSGVCVCRLVSEAGTASRKLTLVR